MVDRAVAAAEEDIQMGMLRTTTAITITTPVDIPTGMTTYGLDIVVKLKS